MKSNKLYRSQSDKILGGVCAGLGHYLGIDPLLIRLFFLILVLFGEGVGVIVYLVLWLVIPLAPTEFTGNDPTGDKDLAERARDMGTELKDALQSPNPQGRLYLGGVLIALGVIFAIQNLDVSWLWWLRFDTIWPTILIIGGIALIFRYFRKDKDE